ncbi:hypothetical protein PVAP13_1NG040100 [Panicum virgatum]|uniref:SHSP domain-containing protein n=1 Tax=Panicum virgatum TaxID=38727 RepID=A0A8T0WFC3_PANVG|nr:hypothetical protein PVAP13_1NG040100 [Panicum virgatum]
MSMITSMLQGRKQQGQKQGGGGRTGAPTAHVVMADLPGERRDEVKVEVEEEKVLKISGQRQRAAEDKGDRWHRVERSSERFVRTVRLPPNANTDTVQATLENGVLTVTVPKDSERKAYGRLIPIAN